MGAPLATRTPEVKTSRSNVSIYAEKGSKHDTDHVFLVVILCAFPYDFPMVGFLCVLFLHVKNASFLPQIFRSPPPKVNVQYRNDTESTSSGESPSPCRPSFRAFC